MTGRPHMPTVCGVVVATAALALRQHGMVDGLTAAARVAARQRRREEAGSGEGGGDGRDGGVGGCGEGGVGEGGGGEGGGGKAEGDGVRVYNITYPDFGPSFSGQSPVISSFMIHYQSRSNEGRLC